MEAYNYFQSGHVRDIKNIQSGFNPELHIYGFR